MKKLFIEFSKRIGENNHYQGEAKEITINKQDDFIEFYLYEKTSEDYLYDNNNIIPSSIIVVNKNDLIHYSITNE